MPESKAAVLYDMPVSNNGARVRLVSKWKGIEGDAIVYVSPITIGGLKSDEYKKLHPASKMPVLVDGDVILPESEVISQYLCDKFRDVGPKLVSETVERRAACNLVTRWHDTYVVPIQGCMYRGPMEDADRAQKIKEIDAHLDCMEKFVQGFEGPYLVSNEPSTADAVLFPTFVFMTHLLPKYFGWKNGVFRGRPKLESWFNHMSTKDEKAKEVMNEVMGGLIAWDESERYTKVGILKAVANDDFQWSH